MPAIKGGLARPRVVLHASEVRTAAIVPAQLAGADGIVDKAADVRELLDASGRSPAASPRCPRITPRLQRRALRLRRRTARSSPCAWPARRRPTSPPPVGLAPDELHARTAAILATLADPELFLVAEHPAPVAAVQR